MKKFIQFTKSSIVIALLMTFAIVFASLSASAQTPEKPIFRSEYPGETHTGYLYSSWEPKVTINEPLKKLLPIVVTWSGSYRATTPFYVGVQINDGPCVFNGPSQIATYFPDDFSSTSVTLQWVFMPGDYKLGNGTNTITLCGASSVWGSDGTITLGQNTMSARLVH